MRCQLVVYYSPFTELVVYCFQFTTSIRAASSSLLVCTVKTVSYFSTLGVYWCISAVVFFCSLLAVYGYSTGAKYTVL